MKDTALLIGVSKKLDKLVDGLKLDPGAHEVHAEVLMEVNLTVTKSQDVSYVPTVKLPVKDVLAVALVKAGFQRDNIAKLIEEAATEALAGGEHVAQAIAVADEAMERVEKTLAKLPKAVRSGPTKVVGSVEFKQVNELAHVGLAA